VILLVSNALTIQIFAQTVISHLKDLLRIIPALAILVFIKMEVDQFAKVSNF